MRVPLLVHAPARFEPRRVADNVSLVDLMPTLLDMASDGKPPTLATAIEGESLAPHACGDTTRADRPVYAELTADACIAPCVMIRQGDFKHLRGKDDPPLLYHPADDPSEQCKLAQDSEHRARVANFETMVDSKWNLAALDVAVRRSRNRRIAIYETFEMGNPPVWDYAVDSDPWQSYQRSFRETGQETEREAQLD